MRRISVVALLCVLLLAEGLLAQSKLSEKRDSLINRLNRANAREQVKIYYDLTFLYRDIDPNKGIELAEKGLALAKKLGDKSGEAEMLIALGGSYAAHSIYWQAYSKYMRALEIAHEVNDIKAEGDAYNSIGLYYYWLSKYEKALDFLTRAESIRQKLPDTLSYANTLNNIGLVELQIKNYSTALDYFYKALKLKDKMKDLASCVRTMSNISLCFNETDRTADALAILDSAMVISKNIDYKGGMALVYSSLGNIYMNTNDYPKSLVCFDQALEIYNSFNAQYAVAEVYYSISQVYNKMNKKEEVIKYALKSLNLSKSINSTNHFLDIYGNLSNIYRSLGDFRKALLYKDSLTIIKDSALTYEKNQTVFETVTLNQMAQKDIEINAKQELIKNQKILLFLTFSGLGLFIVLTLLAYYSYTKKKKIAAELETTKTLFETSFLQTPIPMFLITLPDKRFKYVNEAARRILGIGENIEIENKSMSEINQSWKIFNTDGKLLDVSETPLGRGLSGDIVKEMEIILKNKNGLLSHCLVSTVPVVNSTGKVIGLFEVLPDISRLKEVESQLLKNREELIELNATKDKFFSIVAHDLKSPFHGFLGLSEIIAGDTSEIPPERIKKLASDLNNALKVQYRFLEDLLQWSRVQSDRMVFNPEKNNLSTEVEYVFGILKIIPIPNSFR